MSLPMSRPYKHSKTGVYWVRKVVPEDLRPLVGKTELKRSLKTKDPSEAKRLAPPVIAEFEQVIATARTGQKFTREDLNALTGEYYLTRKEQLAKEARKEQWDWERFDTEAFGLDLIRDAAPHAYINEEEGMAEREAVLTWAMPRVEALLDAHGVLASTTFKEALAHSLYSAEYRALSAARDEVHFIRAPSDEPKVPTFRSPVARSITYLFQKYAQASDLRSKTKDEWGKTIEHFEAWLKGKPADKVTQEDVILYADEVKTGMGLSGRKLSAARVNSGYINPIRATYEWALKRKLVSQNPAKETYVKKSRGEAAPRRRGYTREEVVEILTAARLQTTDYKRWLPWLLAFTGARISEILNAKKADLGQTEGVWYINIREAEDRTEDTLKNTWSTRCVPLHSALLSEGFLSYVDSLPDDEYLFPGDWKDQYGNRTKTPANRLRDWIRTVRPPEDGVAPNHSFRHWLINECKRAKIDPDLQRQLTGHSTKDVHGRYGPGDVPVLIEALEQIRSPL